MGDEVKKSTELFIFSREENLEVVMDTFLACFGMPKAEIGINILDIPKKKL